MSKEVTREKFAGFLEWLPAEGVGAGEAYEMLRWRLGKFFTMRHCRFPDELTDETINRVILKFDGEKIENKLAYCYGVARNVYRESLRRERNHLNVEDVTIAAPPAAEQSFTDECLDKCLAELPPESRSLIIDYYSAEGTEKIKLHRSLSERLALTQTALRMRIFRTKEALKICLEQCMN